MSAPPDLFLLSIKLVVALLVLVGGLWGAQKGLKYLLMQRQCRSEKNLIQILAVKSIGFRHQIALVQVEATRIVLGVTPDRIQCLATLPTRQPGASIPPGPAEAGAQFSELLKLADQEDARSPHERPPSLEPI